jgi:diaminohydroxyphosphoribosylaminopyrimidine deaminase/5-amino-6-(5-phosphoribosylamino)uracil reductase
LVQRVVFFYAPKIIGGRDAAKAVGGPGFQVAEEAPHLGAVEWRRLGEDLLLTARVNYP